MPGTILNKHFTFHPHNIPVRLSSFHQQQHLPQLIIFFSLKLLLPFHSRFSFLVFFLPHQPLLNLPFPQTFTIEILQVRACQEPGLQGCQPDSASCPSIPPPSGKTGPYCQKGWGPPAVWLSYWSSSLSRFPGAGTIIIISILQIKTLRYRDSNLDNQDFRAHALNHLTIPPSLPST